MKIKMSVMITLFILATFLQSCSCTKKNVSDETKVPENSVNKTTSIEVITEHIASKNEIEAETEIEIELETEIESETEAVKEIEKEIWQETTKAPIFFEDQVKLPITLEQAKQIVLIYANFDPSNVTFIKTIKDYNDDIEKWIINFVVNDNEYDYEVNANDGSIIKSTIKTVSYRQVSHLPNIQIATMPDNINNIPANTISVDDAKKIAINNAGFPITNVAFIKTEYIFENDMPKWEIDFVKNDHTYEYEINAIDGTIISAQVE